MIFLILLLSFIIRIISLNQSLWLDEAINIMAAKQFSLFGMVTQYAAADFHPPGWFVIIWFWGKIFGYSEVVMRLPSVFFGVLTVYVTYLIGRKLISRNLGLVAALFISINPLHIYYSQEARMYSLAALAVAVNIFILTKIVKRERINLIFFILSNVLILLSDYVAYFIFPVELIFLLLLKENKFLRRWFIALFTALVLMSWWIPVFLSQLDIGAVTSANLTTWKFVVGGFDFKTVPLTFVKFIIGRINLADKIMYAVLLLPVSILFAYLILQGVRHLYNMPKKLLLLWLLVPPVIATIISFFIPVYSYFRVLFIIPGFVILIANGILSFKDKLRYGFLAAVVLIQVFCTLVYLLNPKFQRDDWKGLVNFFKSIQPEIILFESSGTLPPFDYYAMGSLNAKGALKDFPARDKTAVVDLKEYKEVYLVDYLVQISDPDRFVDDRLKSLGYKISETKDFHGVGFVYHYVKE